MFNFDSFLKYHFKLSFPVIAELVQITEIEERGSSIWS